MPNFPLNLYPLNTPIGKTKEGKEVFLDHRYHRFFFEIIRRLGGVSAFSVSDIETLSSTINSDSLVAEVFKDATEAVMLSLAMGDAPSASSTEISEEDIRDAGFWCPFVNAEDPAAPELIFHDDGSPIVVWNPT